MKELIIDKELNVVGRGTVYVISLIKNKLHITDLTIGGIVLLNGVVRNIKNIEMAQNGNGAFKDTIGIITK